MCCWSCSLRSQKPSGENPFFLNPLLVGSPSSWKLSLSFLSRSAGSVTNLAEFGIIVSVESGWVVFTCDFGLFLIVDSCTTPVGLPQNVSKVLKFRNLLLGLSSLSDKILFDPLTPSPTSRPDSILGLDLLGWHSLNTMGGVHEPHPNIHHQIPHSWLSSEN